MRVVIVGGGVAGLAAGLAAVRAGLEVLVVERRAALDDSERAELVWAGGMTALVRLGVADDVRARGQELVDEDFRSWHGERLYRVPVRELAVATGRPVPIVVSRRDLLHALAAALPEDTLRLGAEVSGIQQDGREVTVSLSDGGAEQGDVLLAADGARSRTRTTVLDGPYADAAPGTWVHGVVPAGGQLQRGRTLLVLGRGDRFVARDLGGGRVSWLAVLGGRRPANREPSRGQLLDRFASFAAPVPALIEQTPPDALATEDVRWLGPRWRWRNGRVVLLGDAAHAAPPSFARGAGAALVDGATLGALLGAHEPATALARYETQRRPAVEAMHEEARRVNRIFDLRSPPAVLLREQVMRRVLSRRVAQRIAKELSVGA